MNRRKTHINSIKLKLYHVEKGILIPVENIANPKQGKIAEVFGAGGGTQIQLGTVVDWYEKLGLMKELK
ncbi:hypothetical protein HB912_06985 [Listeria aquatica]|uniref:DUF4237 domain-containing protein n=1 Tax=Listeria aquatica TaxID=1494960 RepID=A0A841ZPW9_9LIST|nr:hypothetical protein [Listeria aquatica]MBC1521388.1 hypothetical protein [Listeria aquatica]